MRDVKDHFQELEGELHTWLKDAKSVVVAGIGNAIRRDDYVGVKVVEDLRGKVSGKVHLIECETVPESFVDEIIGICPTHVLLVDAALLGQMPGTAHLYQAEEVMNVPSISTHTMPLRVFCDYVKELTGAGIALLLIEPKDTEFGEGMTPELEAAARRVRVAIINNLR
jgi:hydrogenase 3 maturation protease